MGGEGLWYGLVLNLVVLIVSLKHKSICVDPFFNLIIPSALSEKERGDLGQCTDHPDIFLAAFPQSCQANAE